MAVPLYWPPQDTELPEGLSSMARHQLLKTWRAQGRIPIYNPIRGMVVVNRELEQDYVDYCRIMDSVDRNAERANRRPLT